MSLYEILSGIATIAVFIVGLMIKNQIITLKLQIEQSHNQILNAHTALSNKFDGHEELDEERFKNLTVLINHNRKSF